MPKVVNLFMDKNTGKVYNPGDEFHGSQARIDELTVLGLLEAVKKEEPHEVEEADPKPRKKAGSRKKK